MKNRLFSLVILLLLLHTSCTDEDLIRKNAGESTRLSFTINTVDEQIIETRAASDRNSVINDVTLLLLDKDNKFLECVDASFSGNDNKYNGDIKTSQAAYSGGFLYVFANVSDEIRTLRAGWEIGTTEMSEIMSNLKVTLPTNSKYITADPDFSPMVSEKIAFEGKKTYSVTLSRATAEVIVKDNSNNVKYSLLGANMGDVSVSGYVFPNQDFTAIPKNNYAGTVQGTVSPENMMRGIDAGVTDVKQTEPLSVFETSAPSKVEDGAFVIIKGEYDGITGYHRLNLWRQKDGAYHSMPIERNCRYIVNIMKVYTQGYATAEEAIANPASNRDIDVNIEVKDPYSRDIISNGAYYLGVSNSEVIYFGSEAVKTLNLTTVSYNAPSGVKAQCTWQVTEGNGQLTCDNPFSKGVDGSVKSADLIISADQHVSKFEVLLRLGELARKIRFERSKADILQGGVIYTAKNIAYGKATPAGSTSSIDTWVKMSEEANLDFGSIPAGDEYFNTDKTSDLSIVLDNNIILDATDQTKRDARMAEVVLTKANEEGHTCLMINQRALNIFGGDESMDTEGSIENPYVGAFWRSNQSGERIISMYVNGYGNLTWDAQVIIGQNWTRLEAGNSLDKTVDSYNANLNTDINYAEKYQLSSNAGTFVSGTGALPVFRIGLTGTIDPSAHRYGLVLVNTYSNGTLKHTYRIFTRQGDEPDYLFREQDAGWNLNVNKRSKANKISAYNLTDPQLGLGKVGGTMQTSFDALHQMPLDYADDHYTPKDNKTEVKKKFTNYPSQAGYFFAWNVDIEKELFAGSIFYLYLPMQTLLQGEECMLAIHPVNNTNLAGVAFFEDISIENPWSQSVIPLKFKPSGDPCPVGYRMPSIGEVAGDVTDLSFDKSELMQSLLFDPDKSSESSVMSQYTLWGYYADGFFDRLPSSLYENPNRKRSVADIAKATGNDIAYIGMLIFNPYNFGSLFLPAAGRTTPYTLIGSGTTFAIWSNNREYQADGQRANYPLDIEGDKGRFSIFSSQGAGSHARSIRCVVNK